MSSWAEECVSQRWVNTQGMFKYYPWKLLAGRKLTLKQAGSVSPEHFQEMNLALKEEGTTAAGMSIWTLCRLNALPSLSRLQLQKLCKPKLIPFPMWEQGGADSSSTHLQIWWGLGLCLVRDRKILCQRRSSLFSKPEFGEPVLDARPLKENQFVFKSAWGQKITHRRVGVCRKVCSTFVFQNGVLLIYSQV